MEQKMQEKVYTDALCVGASSLHIQKGSLSRACSANNCHTESIADTDFCEIILAFWKFSVKEKTTFLRQFRTFFFFFFSFLSHRASHSSETCVEQIDEPRPEETASTSNIPAEATTSSAGPSGDAAANNYNTAPSHNSHATPQQPTHTVVTVSEPTTYSRGAEKITADFSEEICHARSFPPQFTSKEKKRPSQSNDSAGQVCKMGKSCLYLIAFRSRCLSFFLKPSRMAQGNHVVVSNSARLTTSPPPHQLTECRTGVRLFQNVVKWWDLLLQIHAACLTARRRQICWIWRTITTRTNTSVAPPCSGSSAGSSK